jgi:hypothetical protein
MSEYNRRAGGLWTGNPVRDGDRVLTRVGVVRVVDRGGYWRVVGLDGEVVPGLGRVGSMGELCYGLNLLEVVTAWGWSKWHGEAQGLMGGAR